MREGPVIVTPRGSIIQGSNGSARLEWNSNFQPKFQKQFSEAQKFIDSDILRLCEKKIPLLTGMLRDSGILGTTIGSGTVKWLAPYAAAQYYSPREVGSQTGPERGPFWFERMKAESGKALINQAKKIAGGE